MTEAAPPAIGTQENPLAALLEPDSESKTLGQSLFKSDQHLPMKSRLTGDLVSALALGRIMAQIFLVPELEELCRIVHEERVSMDGLGRSEGVEIGKNTDNRQAPLLIR